MSGRLRAVLAVAAVVLAGCAPGPQEHPIAIDVPTATGTALEETVEEGPLRVTVYLLRGNRLHPVVRPAADVTVDSALGVLLAGPTPQEAAAGVRTAVAPRSLIARATRTAPDTVRITASPDFTEITGPNQILAVAQVVWTATEMPGTTRVTLTVDGTPLEIPTDRGLSVVPVRRADYLSVAPVEPRSPSPSVGTGSPATTSDSRRPERRERTARCLTGVRRRDR